MTVTQRRKKKAWDRKEFALMYWKYTDNRYDGQNICSSVRSSICPSVYLSISGLCFLDTLNYPNWNLFKQCYSWVESNCVWIYSHFLINHRPTLFFPFFWDWNVEHLPFRSRFFCYVVFLTQLDWFWWILKVDQRNLA